MKRNKLAALVAVCSIGVFVDARRNFTYEDNMKRLDKLNREQNKQAFIQQKMQGKRRVY